MNNIFKLKLQSLGHPNPDSFNCEGKYHVFSYKSAFNNAPLYLSLFSDEKEYRSVVLWLEDQKIRHYKIEEREGLRNIENTEIWMKAYDTYQRDLVSPAVGLRPNEQLNWLLSYAVRLEYADNGM